MESAPAIHTFLEVDLNDQDFRGLANAASRIAKLLEGTNARSETRIIGSLDDLLGTIYCLMFARRGHFANRLGPIEPDKVLIRAQQVAAGRLRTDGAWMAGLHFNSSLFRTAAVAHRILQIVIGRDASVPTLCDEAEKLYRWSSGSVRNVCAEVNKLKHKPKGLHERRNVPYEHAVAAVTELLDLIEAWTNGKTPTTLARQEPSSRLGTGM